MTAPTTFRTGIGCLLLVTCTTHAQQLPDYAVFDLGSLGGFSTQGLAINDSGQVTGTSAVANTFTRHAFIYTGGVMTDLGTLEGDTNSTGFAINSEGQVTGQSSPSFPGFQTRGFFYSGGEMTSIGTLGGGNFSSGQGINSSGLIAGSSASDFYTRAVTYSNGVLTDIGFGSYNSFANAINDAGEIAGTFNLGSQNCCVDRAFRYVNGVATDLGTLGGSRAQGLAINSLGEVTGNAGVNDQYYHAYIYRAGTMIDLGALGGATGVSTGMAINTAGDVVGWSQPPAGGGQRAFLYTSGEMFDLNAAIAGSALGANVTLQEATSVNDDAWIVTNGVDSRAPQVTRSYLLVPKGELSITPRPLSFGSQVVSSQGAPFVLSIGNTGTRPVMITSIVIEGVNSADFAGSDNCPRGRFGVGANCSISIRFTPSAAGNRTASVRVVGSAISSPDIVALTGSGTISPTPTPSVSPTAIPTLTPSPTPTASSGSGGGGGRLDALLLCSLLFGHLMRVFQGGIHRHFAQAHRASSSESSVSQLAPDRR